MTVGARLNRFADVVEAIKEQASPDPDLLVRASDVRLESVRFLWDPYIPTGTVTVIAGEGGLGKSHIGVETAARATRGQLVGDLAGEPANVIIATAEDALSQTMVPRLVAAGAELERVSFVRVAERGFSIPDDLPPLSDAMEREQARYVLLDPLVAFLPLRIDSHKDQHARVALAPLAGLAERHDAAIGAVMHLNKASEAGSLFLRVSGSIGFLNASRSALLVAADPEDEASRVIAHGKHNLTPAGPSLKFRIEGTEVERDGTTAPTSRVAWLGESRHGVRDLLRSDHRRDPREGAERFLIDILADGPVLASEVQDAADVEGHAWRTVKRAKADLGVESFRREVPGPWYWVSREVAPLDTLDPVSAGQSKSATSTPTSGPLGDEPTLDAHFYADQSAPSRDVSTDVAGEPTLYEDVPMTPCLCGDAEWMHFFNMTGRRATCRREACRCKEFKERLVDA